MRRILLLHLGNTGHQSAALAIQAALRQFGDGTDTFLVDPVQYVAPNLSRLVHHTYVGLIRGLPEVWDAVYDSGQLAGLTRRLQTLTQRGQSRRFLDFLRRYSPDAVVCTQSYPFGLVADLQARGAFPAGVALYGVVTDYRPHRFWVQPGRSRYVVPSGAASDRLVQLGVERERILVYGIPIRPEFAPGADGDGAEEGAPRILVMGGTLGLGVRYATVRALDRAAAGFSIDVIAGRNQRLRRRLVTNRARFQHPVRVRGTTRRVAALMRRAALLVSKPGGLTCAEAMACGLPMVVVRPLPGQEAGNLEVLVQHGVAIHLEDDSELPGAVEALLRDPQRLASMRRQARALAMPLAAEHIGREVLAAAGGGGR